MASCAGDATRRSRSAPTSGPGARATRRRRRSRRSRTCSNSEMAHWLSQTRRSLAIEGVVSTMATRPLASAVSHSGRPGTYHYEAPDPEACRIHGLNVLFWATVRAIFDESTLDVEGRADCKSSSRRGPRGLGPALGTHSYCREAVAGDAPPAPSPARAASLSVGPCAARRHARGFVASARRPPGPPAEGAKSSSAIAARRIEHEPASDQMGRACYAEPSSLSSELLCCRRSRSCAGELLGKRGFGAAVADARR